MRFETATLKDLLHPTLSTLLLTPTPTTPHPLPPIPTQPTLSYSIPSHPNLISPQLLSYPYHTNPIPTSLRHPTHPTTPPQPLPRNTYTHPISPHHTFPHPPQPSLPHPTLPHHTPITLYFTQPTSQPHHTTANPSHPNHHPPHPTHHHKQPHSLTRSQQESRRATVPYAHFAQRLTISPHFDKIALFVF